MRQQQAIKAAPGGKTVVLQRAPAAPLRTRGGNRSLQSGQRGVSNHVLLRRQEKALQAKLTVGAANDAYEQEANRVAEKVMRMPEPNTAARSFAPRDVGLSSAGPHASTSSSLKSAGVDSVQRKCACGGADGECEECRKKRLQREVGNSGLQVHGGSAVGAQESQVAPPIVHDVLRSPGRPLDAETRAFMEPRFGQDFSDVRVHTDAKAAESALAVNALAYTVGQDVVFGAGQAALATTRRKQLLAHELAHVVQQRIPSISQSATVMNTVPTQEHLNGTMGPHFKGTALAAEHIKSANVATPVSLVPLPRIQRACGQSQIASTAGCRFQLGEFQGDGLLFRFKVGCDEFLTSDDEANLRDLPELLETPGARFIIHGFASEEGSQELNLALSCARAQKAAELLRQRIPTRRVVSILAHGSVPGRRADRRAVLIEVLDPLPPVSKTVTLVSWIDASPLPEFDRLNLSLDPPSIRVLDATGMALRCTANRPPPESLPLAGIQSFLDSKEYRMLQHYTLVLHPFENYSIGQSVPSQQVVGFTAPSRCSEIPPSEYSRGEISPLSHVTSRYQRPDPNLDAFVKFRVGAAEEESAIEKATSFPGSLLFGRSMLPRVPWVWSQTSMGIDPDTFKLTWAVQASAFPTTTVYINGIKRATIPQQSHSVLLASNIRHADRPRQTTQEEEAQAEEPVSRQMETIAAGGQASGTD